MKNLLVGNGLLIEFGGIDYTNKSIVLGTLKNFETPDFPSHVIVNTPIDAKIYFGLMFKEIPSILKGDYNDICNCSSEREALKLFINRYSKSDSLQISDIGFEDYYLIHDLICHKTKTVNPEQFYIRESLKTSFLHSIYNNGKLNDVHANFSSKVVDMFKSYDYIFTTNYDNNIEIATNKDVFHIHGDFRERNDIYNPDSFRNQLSDNPFEKYTIDEKYFYLYSTAISAHCGDYKSSYMYQASWANSGFEKMANAYKNNAIVRYDVDGWKNDKNPLVARLYDAILLKSKNPGIKMSEPYHINEFENMQDHLDIIGLSPYNDFHIFDRINNSPLKNICYYFYNESECQIISERLKLKAIIFKSVKSLWENLK